MTMIEVLEKTTDRDEEIRDSEPNLTKSQDRSGEAERLPPGKAGAGQGPEETSEGGG